MDDDRRKRVLIVDDEEDLTWTLSKKLSKDSDIFELTCVNSGTEAIEMLNQLPFDLVITDVRMPEVSGLDLLVKVRELYPSTKVVIMTAYGTSDVQKEANDRGCFNYIEKPFEINDIRELIISALKRKKGFEGNVSDFQLSDLIQLNCLGRLSTALQVISEDETGLIYFQEGNIVHAETDRYEGENAFHYIMTWDGGEFTVMKNKLPERETITKGWQSLLLESLRRKDEGSDLAKKEAEREKRKRQRRIQQLLARIYKSEGVEHVFLHSRVGFPLYYEGALSDRQDVLSDFGNYIANLIDHVSKYSKFLKGDDLEFWEMRFNQRLFILQYIPDQDAILSIIGKENVNSGYIRLELRKHLDALADLLK